MQKQLFPALAVTATALASLLTFAEEMPATVTVEAEHVITADADNKRNSEGFCPPQRRTHSLRLFPFSRRLLR